MQREDGARGGGANDGGDGVAARGARGGGGAGGAGAGAGHAARLSALAGAPTSSGSGRGRGKPAPVFHMGKKTLKIGPELFALNRRKLVALAKHLHAQVGRAHAHANTAARRRGTPQITPAPRQLRHPGRA